MKCRNENSSEKQQPKAAVKIKVHCEIMYAILYPFYVFLIVELDVVHLHFPKLQYKVMNVLVRFCNYLLYYCEYETKLLYISNYVSPLLLFDWRVCSIWETGTLTF